MEVITIKTWKTKDGKKLLPSEFEDSHLINTLKFIERNAENARLSAELDCIHAQGCLDGEMAQYYAEQKERHFASLSDKEFASLYTPYDGLKKEAEKRKLSWVSQWS